MHGNVDTPVVSRRAQQRWRFIAPVSFEACREYRYLPLLGLQMAIERGDIAGDRRVFNLVVEQERVLTIWRD